MHPEVSEATAGSCPKCGMTLIPRSEAMSEQSTHAAGDMPATYTCPMHSEVQQDTPGKCPKCGMTLVEQTDTHQANGQMMPMAHMDHAAMIDHDMSTMPEHTMSSMSMNYENSESNDKNQHDHAMDMSNHDMHMDGMSMTPRQNYDMMVDMAMSTAQLPWAIVLGSISALLLIALIIFTPWPLANSQPTQDATTAVGQLLLSRYMIGFEGAAFLLLAGIAGAVLLGKRERPEIAENQERPLAVKEPESEMMDTRLYTCPMHPEVRQQGPGHCPTCGMSLMPVEEISASSDQQAQGGHS